ncbi:MAG: AAA family ATPase [Kofleriaceae bacterium]|nr:AAA family ATPase [Kofleriaceae bacterium]
MTTSTLLPVTRAADLAEVATERRWLVEYLWGDEAVGIVGGEPKCCKSFLALALAVAVASGRAVHASLPGRSHRPRAVVRRRGRAPRRATAPRRHRARRRPRARRPRHPGHHRAVGAPSTSSATATR